MGATEAWAAEAVGSALTQVGTEEITDAVIEELRAHPPSAAS
jgi:hypothetical protein